MNDIPPDKDDTPEVRSTFEARYTRTRRSNEFFSSRKPLGTLSRHIQVTQMTQEDDIEEDTSSDDQTKSSSPVAKKKNRDSSSFSSTQSSTTSTLDTPTRTISTRSTTTKRSISTKDTGVWLSTRRKKKKVVKKRNHPRLQFKFKLER